MMASDFLTIMVIKHATTLWAHGKHQMAKTNVCVQRATLTHTDILPFKWIHFKLKIYILPRWPGIGQNINDKMKWKVWSQFNVNNHGVRVRFISYCFIGKNWGNHMLQRIKWKWNDLPGYFFSSLDISFNMLKNTFNWYLWDSH